MEGLKEILDLLGKAKDTRIYVALLITCLFSLWLERSLAITLPTVLSGLLQLLVFISIIVIIARGIGYFYDKVEEIKTRSRELKKQDLVLKAAESAAKKRKEKLERDIEALDIFQLLVLQNMRKANTAQVVKCATLFTLKTLGIVRTVATGQRRESVQFTDLAMTFCDEQFWNTFSSLKKKAAAKFFNSLETKELNAFKVFLLEDRVNTSFTRGRTTVQSSDGRVYNLYSSSVLFQQPQIGYVFEIDPAAKKALSEVLVAIDD